MPNIQVQLRRGSATEHATFSGAEGEVTVDTTNDTLHVHTGGGAGTGVRLAKHSEANVQSDWNETDTSSTAFILNKPSITAAPTGTVTAFAGATAPTGYVLCDGSEYSETTEAALFAVLGSTYNTGGETANHFRVPDLRGRVVAGLGESLLGATADTLGEDNGAIADTKEHTLTTSEMPSHQHFSFKAVSSTSNVTSATTPATNYTAGAGADYTIKGSGSDADVGLTSSFGSGSAHNNVQPTMILNYIIKT